MSSLPICTERSGVADSWPRPNKSIVVAECASPCDRDRMRIEEHLQELQTQGEALATAAGRAGLSAPVPSCPGWQVADLIGHIGAVHLWAAAIVLAPPGSGRVAMPEPPAQDRLDWYREAHRRALHVLTDAPDDLECFTFFAAPSPKAFWARRQAHETAMHRADAQAGLGETPIYPSDFAVDGIDELLFGFLGRLRSRLVADPPRSLLVRATDADAWWHISMQPDGHEIRASGDENADCVVTGSASDLYLFLWNRPPQIQPDVSGDGAVLELWRELAVV
jgi:uncharacterized protein (TIGR03083 family)